MPLNHVITPTYYLLLEKSTKYPHLGRQPKGDKGKRHFSGADFGADIARIGADFRGYLTLCYRSSLSHTSPALHACTRVRVESASHRFDSVRHRTRPPAAWPPIPGAIACPHRSQTLTPASQPFHPEPHAIQTRMFSLSADGHNRVDRADTVAR